MGDEASVELTLIHAAFAYVRSRHPGATVNVVTLTITPDGGCPVRVSIHPARVVSYNAYLERQARRGEQRQLPAREAGPSVKEKVVAALREAGKPLKAISIARRGGMKYGPHLRKTLSVMLSGNDAILAWRKGEGYSLRQLPAREVDSEVTHGG